MKVNGKEIVGERFAYDGCHKIYVVENDEEAMEAASYGYELLPLRKLQGIWDISCELRFISPWNLNKEKYVKQFEEAKFEDSPQ